MRDARPPAAAHDGALVVPAAPGAPAVVLLHSWWGLTDHFRELSTRLAAAGFTAVTPDLYDGRCTDDPIEARRLRLALSDEVALDLAAAAVRQAESIAGTGRVALIGFSRGGELALRLAAAMQNVVAVSAFYGVCVPDDLPGLRASVQLHVATDDEFATPEEIGEVTTSLVAHHKQVELHSYPGTRHAFFNRSHPESYDHAAAELAWRRTCEFFAAAFGRTP